VLRDAPSCSPVSNEVQWVIIAMLTCEKVPNDCPWQVHGAARFLAFSLMPTVPSCRSSSSGSSCPVARLHIPLSPIIHNLHRRWAMRVIDASTALPRILDHGPIGRLAFQKALNAPPTPREHFIITDPPYAKQCILSTYVRVMIRFSFAVL
jgi:hypothetical protein